MHPKNPIVHDTIKTLAEAFPYCTLLTYKKAMPWPHVYTNEGLVQFSFNAYIIDCTLPLKGHPIFRENSLMRGIIFITLDEWESTEITVKLRPLAY